MELRRIDSALQKFSVKQLLSHAASRDRSDIYDGLISLPHSSLKRLEILSRTAAEASDKARAEAHNELLKDHADEMFNMLISLSGKLATLPASDTLEQFEALVNRLSIDNVRT